MRRDVRRLAGGLLSGGDAMRKIEVVAADYVRSPDLDPFHSYADIFLAGVRYVLDAMTSDAAVKAVDRVRILRTSTLEQLVAVRKEIEGE